MEKSRKKPSYSGNFTRIPNDILYQAIENLNPTALKLFLVFWIESWGGQREVTASYSKIAGLANVSKGQLQRSFDLLESAGFLIRVKDLCVNTYRVEIPDGDCLAFDILNNRPKNKADRPKIKADRPKIKATNRPKNKADRPKIKARTGLKIRPANAQDADNHAPFEAQNDILTTLTTLSLTAFDYVQKCVKCAPKNQQNEKEREWKILIDDFGTAEIEKAIADENRQKPRVLNFEPAWIRNFLENSRLSHEQNTAPASKKPVNLAVKQLKAVLSLSGDIETLKNTNFEPELNFYIKKLGGLENLINEYCNANPEASVLSIGNHIHRKILKMEV